MSETNGQVKYAEMVFEDLAPIEVPVRMGGKRYVLVEASEDAACKYRNHTTGCARFENGRMVGLSGPIADVEPLLVSLCLFELYDHQGETRRRPVTLNQVKGWPARVVRPLFERAKEIGGLQEEDDPTALRRRIAADRQRLAALESGEAETAEGAAKNSPAATADTSV